MKIWRILLGFLTLSGFAAVYWLRHVEETMRAPYVQVEDGLFLGAAVKVFPPGTEAVVNLNGTPDSQTVAHCLWRPVFDGDTEPSLPWLRETVAFVTEQRRAGRVTFVHCLAGTNRSATVVIAYLMLERGWSRDAALAHLQKRRPLVQPNPEMMRLLAEWQRDISSQ